VIQRGYESTLPASINFLLKLPQKDKLACKAAPKAAIPVWMFASDWEEKLRRA
jgi:hypothetical protein